MSENKES